MAMTKGFAEKLCARGNHCFHEDGNSATCCWCTGHRERSKTESLPPNKKDECFGDHGPHLEN